MARYGAVGMCLPLLPAPELARVLMEVRVRGYGGISRNLEQYNLLLCYKLIRFLSTKNVCRFKKKCGHFNMTSSLLVVTPILPAKLYHVSNLRSSDAGDPRVHKTHELIHVVFLLVLCNATLRISQPSPCGL